MLWVRLDLFEEMVVILIFMEGGVLKFQGCDMSESPPEEVFWYDQGPVPVDQHVPFRLEVVLIPLHFCDQCTTFPPNKQVCRLQLQLTQ